MTTRVTEGARRERHKKRAYLFSSWAADLVSRGFAVRRSRASALPSLNLKKKRDCSQSMLARRTRKTSACCAGCGVSWSILWNDPFFSGLVWEEVGFLPHYLGHLIIFIVYARKDPRNNIKMLKFQVEQRAGANLGLCHFYGLYMYWQWKIIFFFFFNFYGKSINNWYEEEESEFPVS